MTKTASTPGASVHHRANSFFSVNELPLVTLLIALLVVFTILNPDFLTVANWQTIGRSYLTELALLAMAEAVVILTRGIDLSVAATLALSAVTVGIVAEHTNNIYVAVAAALLVGMMAGGLNGCLIVYLHVTPIVATLATLTLYRGISLGVTQGQSFGNYPTEFMELGNGSVLGIPNPVLVLAVILAILVYVLGRTVVGRWVYAVGGNASAARFSGIPVGRTTIGVYTLAGLLAAVGGVLATARFGTARADFAAGAELDAITAVVLGGISILGGRGYVIYAVVGALVIAVLRSGLTLEDQSGYLQTVAIGVVLLAAVLSDRRIREWRRSQLSAKQLRRSASNGLERSSDPPSLTNRE